MITVGKTTSNKKIRRIFGIILILPALAFMSFTIIIPQIWNIVLSFQKWDGFSKIEWVNFQNYIKIFQDHVTKLSFYNSIFIAFVSAIAAVFSGLLLALMIYRVTRIEGAFYRLIFFTPVMLPLTVVGLLFVFIYNPEKGLLNNFLKLIGLQSLTHAWLTEPVVNLLAISFTGAWRIAGITMMLCFTAITSIPSSLYEAGMIEGASFFKQVRMIILPLIMPTLELSAMLTLIITFKTYDLVWVMTEGGPGNLSMTVPVQMLNVGFMYNEFGYAAAIGTLLTVLVVVLIFAIRKIIRGEVYEY